MKQAAHKITIALLAGILCLSLAGGQNQQQTTTPPGPSKSVPQNQGAQETGAIRASTDVVRIDVEVTDKSGKPIKGLRRPVQHHR